MQSRDNVIGVGTYMYVCMYVYVYACVQKKYLNAALSADSPPESLAEALSRTRTLQTNGSIESSEALSTLNNPALYSTLSIKAHSTVS